MPEEIVRVNEANQKSDRLEKQVATPAGTCRSSGCAI